MFHIEHAVSEDLEDILLIDTFIPRDELIKKIATRPEELFVLKEDGQTVGLLRYGIFWDYIPYACFLNVSEQYRGKGYAKKALLYWEEEMRIAGWPIVMTSIPTDDPAQHFYRKMGYKDAGCLVLDLEPYVQPMEIFFIKKLS